MAGKKKKNKKKRSKGIVLGISLGLLVVAAAAVYWFFQLVSADLPSLDQLENPRQELSSNVFSQDGKLIGSFFVQNRVETPYDSIPKVAIEALVATEDRKFYEHWGVDIERFIKAMIKNIVMGRREGGSTITQQLAKNLYSFKGRRETLFQTGIRKIREWITAVQIERNYTKQEILEMYFNESYFGNGAYGIGMAAKTYFNKKPQNLTVPEAALLVAQLKSPAYYNPVRHYNNALSRRNLIMHNMVAVGYLTENEYKRLSQLPINISMEKIRRGFKSELAPKFLEFVRQQMSSLSKKRDFNLYKDGLSIFTTLDSRMQLLAREAVDEYIPELQKTFDESWDWKEHQDLYDKIVDENIKGSKDYKIAPTAEAKIKVYHKLKNNIPFIDSIMSAKTKVQVGVVVIDPKTGDIKALIGGRNKQDYYGLNHITQIFRQPGSCFKPIIYTAAIENGLYPAYPILNQRFDYNEWSPQNYNKETGGFMTLRDGLRKSKNIIAARLVIEGHVELWQIGKLARRLGIKSKLDLYPAITLGATQVTPLEMVSVFSTLANKGIYIEPTSIKQVEDKDGIIIANFTPKSREAISAGTDYIITNMLQSVVNAGTGYWVKSRYGFDIPAAGKTGTTQNFADAWFIGFTSDLVAGVWTGFDDQRITFKDMKGTGAKCALPVWALFMKKVYEQKDDFGLTGENFQMPDDGSVAYVDFCKESIYEYGNPRIVSDDCNSGVVTDLIKVEDIPPPFNYERDAEVKLFDKYMYFDSSGTHRAIEIK
jgi:penicillin-binding protein 1A